MTQKFSQGHSTDTQAPPRAFSSSLGQTPELSHPGMGFDAVPIWEFWTAGLGVGHGKDIASHQGAGELLELQRKCFLAQV